MRLSQTGFRLGSCGSTFTAAGLGTERLCLEPDSSREHNRALVVLSAVVRSFRVAMNSDQLLLLSLAVALVAFLYSSVGHAGASGYIAVMSLAGLEPGVIRSTALALNIIVATITIWQFFRRGYFSWSLFWPFALPAVPMAFLGGSIDVPAALFRIIVGLVLLFSALRFLMRPGEDPMTHPPSPSVAIPIGAGLGFLSGLTGTGGGIFLTPLMLMMRWAGARTAAGVSSLFILCNSVAGLIGSVSNTGVYPENAVTLAMAAILGGAAGSYLGSHRFSPEIIKRLLAAVLLIAAGKLLLTD